MMLHPASRQGHSHPSRRQQSKLSAHRLGVNAQKIHWTAPPLPPFTKDGPYQSRLVSLQLDIWKHVTSNSTSLHEIIARREHLDTFLIVTQW